MRAMTLTLAGGFTLAVLMTPATPQEIRLVPVDANHVRVDNVIYDIRAGSSEEGIALRGPSTTAEELVRQVIAAECLRPDEADLSRHDCYINHDGKLVHRPAKDTNGPPQGAIARCRDGTYTFSQHHMEHARTMAA
jgi:hypothetical protein